MKKKKKFVTLRIPEQSILNVRKARLGTVPSHTDRCENRLADAVLSAEVVDEMAMIRRAALNARVALLKSVKRGIQVDIKYPSPVLVEGTRAEYVEVESVVLDPSLKPDYRALVSGTQIRALFNSGLREFFSDTPPPLDPNPNYDESAPPEFLGVKHRQDAVPTGGGGTNTTRFDRDLAARSKYSDEQIRRQPWISGWIATGVVGGPVSKSLYPVAEAIAKARLVCYAAGYDAARENHARMMGRTR